MSYSGVIQLGKIIKEQEARKRYNYEIIYGKNLKEFQRKIRFYLNNGWNTEGNVFIKDDLFCQPMIRVEYNND